MSKRKRETVREEPIPFVIRFGGAVMTTELWLMPDGRLLSKESMERERAK